MAFLDIKAAYYSVPRGEIWRRCEQTVMHNLLLDVMRTLFDHNSAKMVLSQKRTQRSPWERVYSLKHGPMLMLPSQTEG
jgi:hypothetical protein